MTSILILDGKRPAFLADFLKKLEEIPFGPLLESYQVVLETHPLLLTTVGLSNLFYQLKIRYDHFSDHEKNQFDHLLDNCGLSLTWLTELRNIRIFQEVIDFKITVNGVEVIKTHYNSRGKWAFVLIRNFYTHIPDMVSTKSNMLVS